MKPERLSRADAARWHMGTPTNPMVIGALLLFERRLTLEAVEALVRDKLVPHRRFRQHVGESPHRFGAPRWLDDAAFDLHEHVRRLDPSGPVDAATLLGLVSERMNAPLPPERSPWTFEVVDLLPSGSALLVRIHHCIADGRALVALLEQLADHGSDEDSRGSSDEGSRATEEQSPTRKSSQPTRARRFFRQLGGLFRFPLSRDPVSLLRRPLNGRKCVAWSEAIPLEPIKALAAAHGHHVADVLLAGVAGALDRYAREHGQVPRSVHTLLPVAAAPSRASAGELGNHYASVFVSLPAAVDDPRARLEMIARDMAVLRSGGQSRIASGLMRVAGSVAPGLERRAMRWGSRRASLVVSSLAGPKRSLHVAGQPLGAVVIWAPAAATIGLSITLFGYAGAIRLGVLADSAVIDRPEELVVAFQAALDELRRGTAAER
ncbi:MAG TPA: WS/DGAT domain-containing protein [Polyangia bacterium]|nr:WS/DGAT domain-containing protein [Polyangia bacterium]